MLSRGLFDAVVLWPVAFWPMVFSSCFVAAVRLCHVQRSRHGVALLGEGRWARTALNFGLLPAVVTVELSAHGYMLMVAGYEYAAVALPIYIFGWILLPALLDGMRSAVLLLSAGHVLFLAAFTVLMGFWEVEALRMLNRDLYALLAGVPASL